MLGLRETQLCCGARKFGLSALELRLVWTWVDDKEDVALADFAAFGEIDRRNVAGNARPQFDAVHRGEAASEFVELGDGSFNDLRHAHLGRRGRRLGGFVSRTAGGGECDQCK